MKAWLFVMIFMTSNGQLPPQKEPMESLKACTDRMIETQEKMAAINEDFQFMTACVQASKKADPA